MNKFRIEAPVRSYTGESAGVSFSNGTGYVNDGSKEGRAALEYFRRQGYAVLPADEETEEATEVSSGTGAPVDELTNLGHGSAPSVGFGLDVVETPPAPPTPAGPDEPVTPVEFDPSKHSQDEVIAYLDKASDEEVARIKAAESVGKNRRQIAAYERKTTPAPAADDTKGEPA
ncbi:hypothetical protein ACH4UY_04930 [Streptomyces longwoodensis]|uniref:hypothetical protein n=1 Tax=Streptomyces longwoodensis TaxID=68231 RepID=UPI0037A5FA1E